MTRHAWLLVLLLGCARQPAMDRCIDAAPQRVVAVPASEPKVAASPVSAPDVVPDRVAQLRDMVRLVYGDLNGMEARALTFKSEALSTADMQQVVPLVASYNGFESARISAALGRLRGEIAYYQFAREDSPVIYVHLPYWTSQQEKNCPEQRCDTDRSGPKDDARRLEAGEHAALLERVRSELSKAGADDVAASDDNDHIVRAWWD